MEPHNFRVNPSATTERSTESPMEIAALKDFAEVLKILAEFTEITDKVKLLQLYNLMNSDNFEKSREEFQRILRSLPVHLVSSMFSNFPFLFPSVRFHFETAILKMYTCCSLKMKPFQIILGEH